MTKRPFCCACLPAVFSLLLLTAGRASAKTYFIDPQRGDDGASGAKDAPWKTFVPLNKRTLGAGDRVTVSPGELTASLAPQVRGTAKEPVVIKFRPGRYDWQREGLVKRKLAISNTNDCPDEEKAIAMELVGAKHLRIEGAGAQFFCRGKMIEVHLEEAKHVVLKGFAFDYERPTVSEYTATEVGDKYALIRIHKDSKYRIEGGRLIWVGEGWELPADSRQAWCQTQSADGTCARRGGPGMTEARVTEIEPGLVRYEFDKNPGFAVGPTYQQRCYTRDCCGIFCDRSSNIRYEGLKLHFMHGMGVVSQFSENLSFDKLTVAPRPESGRTSSAWADILHFSGCSGQITVRDCLLSCANDDAINNHGTHLCLTACSADRKQVTVKFMHKQTFGFAAFRPGDEVQITSSRSLLPLGTAKVKSAELAADGRSMQLTLNRPLPEGVKLDADVLENVTATAALTVENCRVQRITTRGFLITTRRPVLIRNCVFDRTGMPALLMEDDANHWYESGPVHDMRVENNQFIQCAEPVISFNPMVAEHAGAVHRHILIRGNRFELQKGTLLKLKSTDDVRVINNTVNLDKPVQEMIHCENSAPVLYK